MKTSGASRKTRPGRARTRRRPSLRVTAEWLLALTLTLAAFAPVPLVRAAGSEDDGPPSSAENQEARAIAVRFVGHMQERGDAGPLVSELFLPDFAERLQKFAREGGSDDDTPVFLIVARPVLAQATPDDLRRAFVALVNLWHHSGEFGDAVSDVTEARHNLVSVVAEERGWKLRAAAQRGALPPAFLDTCRSDPLLMLLSKFFDEAGGDADTDDGGDEGDSDALLFEKVRAASVRSFERLRALTEKIEKCAALLGEATRTLREEMKAYPERARVKTIDASDVYRVEADAYDKELFGFPPRTRFISARLFPYVLVMVRLEDRLQILGVLPDFDGD